MFCNAKHEAGEEYDMEKNTVFLHLFQDIQYLQQDAKNMCKKN